jgi:hypothetical protein
MTTVYNYKSGEDHIEFITANTETGQTSSNYWTIKLTQNGGKVLINIQNRLGISFEDEDFSQIIAFITEYGMKWL